MMTLTDRQTEALKLLANPSANSVLLYGGSRSGKTSLFLYAMICRALKASGSRHAVVRNIYRDCRQKIGMISLPELHRMLGINPTHDKGNGIYIYPGGSEIWLCGLDDAGERHARILGSEYSTILFEEATEIPYESTVLARTRLSQKNLLVKRSWYSCNPPSTEHWLHHMFVKGLDPTDRTPLRPGAHFSLRMNPDDNRLNIDGDYIRSLDELPERQRLRFRDGQWGTPLEGVLWRREWIENNRIVQLHEELVDTVVGVDPACGGSCSTGIVAVGRGASGHLYVLADRTTRGTPAEWSAAVVGLAKEAGASRVIAEANQGGNMVSEIIRMSNPVAVVELVHAGDSKRVRAEPVAALAERGLLHHVGQHIELEDQLLSWSPGQESPDRLDAMVHACAALSTVGMISPQVARAGISVAGMEDDVWTHL